MAILEMQNISLTYQTRGGETDALKDVSLSVKSGEFIALIGPSGCGKTTVLSLVAGLIRPTAGRVTVEGKEVVGPSPRVGYMLQRDQLFEWRTIEKNVMLGLEVQKNVTRESRAYALGLVEKYGLKDFLKSLPKELSGGMRQRAALIRTLAFRPEILLLDEPFSALDYQTRLAVCDDVHGIIRAENKTALLVTHDISEAISTADRVAVLSARPARVKNIYGISLPGTPLQRRENPGFSKWFDIIWKDVSV
ncbi:MAG: ABC transporter ATP-binding protein [Clostridiales bacterium]|nr:ABC transporter ATP-binding protein [Clostridiales bacterium]